MAGSSAVCDLLLVSLRSPWPSGEITSGAVAFGVREIDPEAQSQHAEEPPLDPVEEARSATQVRRIGQLRRRFDRGLLMGEVDKALVEVEGHGLANRR